MANLLIKTQKEDVLLQLGYFKLYYEYRNIKTDYDLVEFYNELLNNVEGNELAENFVYSMISYSTGIDSNPLYLLMQNTIYENNTI